jgi:hypothetical protein
MPDYNGAQQLDCTALGAQYNYECERSYAVLAEPFAKLMQAALLRRHFQLFAEVAPANGRSRRSS